MTGMSDYPATGYLSELRQKLNDMENRHRRAMLDRVMAIPASPQGTIRLADIMAAVRGTTAAPADEPTQTARPAAQSSPPPTLPHQEPPTPAPAARTLGKTSKPGR